MNKTKTPWTIKYTIAVNVLSIVSLVICSLTAAFLGFTKYYPILFSKAEEMGVQLDPAQFVLLFVASVILWLLPIPLLLYSNRGILNQRKNNRFVQISISLVFLMYFPFGAVLHGVILYYFLIDQKTKDYLTGSLTNV